jgi:hypothetical protein
VPFSPAFLLSLIQRPRLKMHEAAQILADELPGGRKSRGAGAAFRWLCEHRGAAASSAMLHVEVDVIEAAGALESEGNRFLGRELRQALRDAGLVPAQGASALSAQPPTQRRNVLSRPIEEAIRRAGSDQAVDVYAQLQQMVQEGFAPLRCYDPDKGIGYRRADGSDGWLDVNGLRQRLLRRRRRRVADTSPARR